MTQTAQPTVKIDIAHGELIDKITILQIKNERIADAAKLENIRTELDVLTAQRDDAIPPSAELDGLTAELKAINEKLWDIEDDVRDCERQKDFSDTFVQLARSVYFSNDIRSDIKRKINVLCGAAFLEEKSYQPY